MTTQDRIIAIQKVLFPDQPEEWDGKPGGKWDKALLELKSAVQTPETQQNDAGEAAEGIKWPREADAAAFYGNSDGSSAWESENLVLLPAPYAMFMDGQLVRNIRCHRKVRDSLWTILNNILKLYKTPEAIAAAGLDQYDGCYNFRNVRGASHLSMHSYGAAIDFDAAHNPLGATHGKMPMEVVAIFKAEGWRWGGNYENRKDLMHFEACR